MKKIKNIIAVLAVVLTVFGCQTNEELTEMETLNQSKVNLLNNYTNILIEFKKGVLESEKAQVRSNFASNLSFVLIQECRTNKEVWLVNNIEYQDFLFVLHSLYDMDDINTTLSGGNDDEIPDPEIVIPSFGFKVKYGEDCSYIFD